MQLCEFVWNLFLKPLDRIYFSSEAMTADTLNNYRDIPPYWGFPGGSDSKEPACNARVQFSSVQSLSRVWLFATPWTAARQASLSITNSQSLLKLMSIKSVMPSNYLIPFSSHLQSFPASGSFQMSQFFTSSAQSIGVSASVLPMSIQDWFPLRWTGWIYLQSDRKSVV